METQKRVYIKEIFPEIYEQTKNLLLYNEYAEVVYQLDHLYITGLCSCGQCSSFEVDSDIPDLNRDEHGSHLRDRPLFTDLDCGFRVGIAWCTDEDDMSYISGWETDVLRPEIESRLQEFGFRRIAMGDPDYVEKKFWRKKVPATGVLFVVYEGISLYARPKGAQTSDFMDSIPADLQEEMHKLSELLEVDEDGEALYIKSGLSLADLMDRARQLAKSVKEALPELKLVFRYATPESLESDEPFIDEIVQ